MDGKDKNKKTVSTYTAALQFSVILVFVHATSAAFLIGLALPALVLTTCLRVQRLGRMPTTLDSTRAVHLSELNFPAFFPLADLKKTANERRNLGARPLP